MKLIHVSDLRLNSACESFGSMANVRKEELWETFEEICRACNSRQVGLLLLSGNIFDREPTFDEMARMHGILKKLVGTSVVWIAGYLDQVYDDYSYTNYAWPEHVHVIKQIERVHLPALGCYVTGVSYNQDLEGVDLLPYIKTEQTDELQILAMCSDSKHLGFRHEQLAAKGFDYVALGGKSNFSIWENERCAYSGSHEPLDSSETGNHGYIFASVTKAGTAIELVDIAKRHFRMAMLYLTEKMSIADIRKNWKSSKAGENGFTFFKLVAKGRMPIGISVSDLEQLDGVSEVVDNTGIGYDKEALKAEHSNDILGAFIESIEKIDNELSDRAADYGISALLKGDVL